MDLTRKGGVLSLHYNNGRSIHPVRLCSSVACPPHSAARASPSQDVTTNAIFLAPSFTSTLLLSSSLPPTCFYITLFSMRSTLPYMSQLIGPAAQLKFTIATMIQSPSNGFYFHPTSYSGTPISQQPTVQWMNLLISDKV
ncbi:hypothetical protein QQF64_032241 [Cirrhinus molitorella]|uniref:Uncharacterized protein n=1 Tax=Cirrhinus molitorella TaxID=172907 RepID=A0ABR3MZB7_9TELE